MESNQGWRHNDFFHLGNTHTPLASLYVFSYWTQTSAVSFNCQSRQKKNCLYKLKQTQVLQQTSRFKNNSKWGHFKLKVGRVMHVNDHISEPPSPSLAVQMPDWARRPQGAGRTGFKPASQGFQSMTRSAKMLMASINTKSHKSDGQTCITFTGDLCRG